MNSVPDEHIAQMSFSVGKGGGSAGELFHSRWSGRGLYPEQEDESDPLVIWWARLLAKGNSAHRSERDKSYRRSRWGQAELKPSPFSPYSALHKQGRLINFSLCALIFAFGSSLNMVALAETSSTGGAVTHGGTDTSQTPYSERFSRMKDFVGQHNQYLDLSKLNEFKWTEDSHVVAARQQARPAAPAVFSGATAANEMQPPAVNRQKSKKSRQSDLKLREERKNRAVEPLDSKSDRWAETAK